MSTVQLSVVDYILAGIFLCVSLGIGIFYGVCRKAQTTDDYLYGNRNMHLLPVALSLMVTYTSATSCLGVPAEIYTYNTMIFYGDLGQVLGTAVSAFTIVPLLYPLKLNSAYEYLGRRFNSRSVQLLGTFIGMLQTLLYMSVVLFSPALALEAVAGIPLWASIIVVGIIGTVYTSLGGFRSVIWTDVFQFIILYSGMIVILVLGVHKVGSVWRILDVASENGRLGFNASFDPRVRHSMWSCVIGGMFIWFPNTCQQSAVQRICSMRSQRDAKIAMLINMPFSLLFSVIAILVSLVFFAYFMEEQCGPVESGAIGSANQVMPYFVMLILHNIPGIAGILLAALFSGALSSLSSGINALATNTLHDLMPGCKEKMSQAQQTLLAKFIVFVYGIVAVVIAYFMKSITGPVTQIANTAFGACGGPYFGIFCLGALFPQGNWIGALVGGLVGIIFNVWLAISTVLHALPAPQSTPIPTSGCSVYSSINQTTTPIPHILGQHNSTFITDSFSYMEPKVDSTLTPYLPLQTEDGLNSGMGHLYNISYLYFGLTGFIVSLTVGLIVSIFSRCDTHDYPDAIYLFPFVRKLWMPKQSMDKYSYHLTGNDSPQDEESDKECASSTSKL